MKKIYATVFAFGALTSLQAQLATNRADRNKLIDNTAQHSSGGAERSSIHVLANAQNMYTVLLSGQNQVSYNPEVNTLLFGHRQNAADNGNQGGSGTIRFDYSTDGGSNWTLNTLLTDELYNGGPATDSVTGGRYPSITMYNPPGNTDASNVYAVSMGSVLTTLTAGQWGLVQASSAKLDGSNVNDTYFSPWGDLTGFHPYGLQYKSDGTMWTLISRYSETADNSDGLAYTRFAVMKGVFNTNTNVVDWTIQYELPWDVLIYEDPTNGTTGQVTSWNMAFSPDGMTGYAVINGAQTDGVSNHPHPYLWKTTDGGDNWSALPTHDFSTEQWMIDHIMPTDDGSVTSPYFSDMDCTVDANGAFHMVSEVVSGYSNTSVDSAGYTFTALESQFIVHLSTSDGSAWTIDLMSPVLGTDFEFPTSPTPPGASQSNRPQASRTADGTKVFFTYNSSGLNETENSFPDIFGCSYSTTNSMWASVKNLTEGSDAEQAAWFHTVSPVCISNGAEHDFELPTVYANPGALDVDPCGFTYIKGIGFDESEYTDATLVAVGVEELNPLAHVGIYPNPSNGQFNINLIDMGRVDLIVTDVTGRVVRTAQANGVNYVLDLTGGSAGVYTVTMRNAKGQASKTIMLF